MIIPLFLTLALSALIVITAEESSIAISVSFNASSNSFVIKKTLDDSFDAFGTYYFNYKNGGWNYLDISMQTEISSIDDHLQYSSSMGYLEGYVTCSEIRDFYPNFYATVFSGQTPNKQVLTFIEDNFVWLSNMSDQYFKSSNYWYTIKAMINQLRGLYHGYSDGCTSPSSIDQTMKWSHLDQPTFTHFLLLNAWRELPNMLESFPSSATYNHLGAKGTFFIKLLSDKSDVLFGHTTWDRYELLGPRISKHYNFPLMRNGFAEHHYDIYFTSSPGLISSLDDLVVVNGYSNLAILDSTLPLYDNKGYSNSSSVLAWTRAMVSNQLARSGSEWTQIFSLYHSGTYNAQWAILDFKAFKFGQKPSKGFFSLFEEASNYITVDDVTDVLIQHSFFGSYNLPFFNTTAHVTGTAEVCENNSNFCYESSPRAKLLFRYQSDCNDIDGLKWLLSYNSFQNDTESNNNPCETISCRGDLFSDFRRSPYGALDSKVSSAFGAKRKIGIAPSIQSRMGTSFDQQLPFCWSEFSDDVSHLGQPECFKFDWITFST